MRDRDFFAKILYVGQVKKSVAAFYTLLVGFGGRREVLEFCAVTGRLKGLTDDLREALTPAHRETLGLSYPVWRPGALAVAYYGLTERLAHQVEGVLEVQRTHNHVISPGVFSHSRSCIAGTPMVWKDYLRVQYAFRDVEHAAQLSAAVGVLAGVLYVCAACGHPGVREEGADRRQKLCGSCSWLRTQATWRQSEAWERYRARLRARGQNTPEVWRPALAALRRLPFEEWKRKYLEADKIKPGRPPLRKL